MTIILDAASALQAVLIVGGAVIIAPLMIGAYYWVKKEWAEQKGIWAMNRARRLQAKEDRKNLRDFLQSRRSE